ncbi:MAG TPA: hypothetical protein VMB83_13250 [Roseiarcus sp.]|nr:hypothetical protein [Roseiarcus sp.]
MKTIDRRGFAGAMLMGAAAAGLALAAGGATAMPLDDRVPADLNDWIEKTQVWVGTPPRRHWRRRRVWRCWWHRGRRVCGWRWV